MADCFDLIVLGSGGVASYAPLLPFAASIDSTTRG
jgi:hypothetical protein